MERNMLYCDECKKTFPIEQWHITKIKCVYRELIPPEDRYDSKEVCRNVLYECENAFCPACRAKKLLRKLPIQS